MSYIPPRIAFISTANSTTSVLAGAGVFTGTAEDVSDYSNIKVNVYTSHGSATDGMKFQQSSDGTNWDIIDSYTVPALAAGAGRVYTLNTAARYFRVVYTNGAILQTSFRLQVIYQAYHGRASSMRPQDSRPNEIDLDEVAAYNMTYDATADTWFRARGVSGVLQQGLVPQTVSGLSGYRLLSLATTNLGNVKTSAGKLFVITAINLNAAVRYLKLYNKASAPVLATDVPVHTIPIPASTTGAGIVIPLDTYGETYSLGIGIATTTGVADTDTGAVAANEIIINLWYL